MDEEKVVDSARSDSPKDIGTFSAIEISNLSLGYRDNPQALVDISLEIPERSVTAIIGASGCGKSTLLRCLNRMNDLIDGVHYQGRIRFEGENILDARTNVTALRRQIGMVFQKPNPFPKSVFENVANVSIGFGYEFLSFFSVMHINNEKYVQKPTKHEQIVAKKIDFSPRFTDKSQFFLL